MAHPYCGVLLGHEKGALVLLQSALRTVLHVREAGPADHTWHDATRGNHPECVSPQTQKAGHWLSEARGEEGVEEL